MDKVGIHGSWYFELKLGHFSHSAVFLLLSISNKFHGSIHSCEKEHDSFTLPWRERESPVPDFNSPPPMRGGGERKRELTSGEEEDERTSEELKAFFCLKVTSIWLLRL